MTRVRRRIPRQRIPTSPEARKVAGWLESHRALRAKAVRLLGHPHDRDVCRACLHYERLLVEAQP